MPGIKKATLMLAAHYLQLLFDLNDLYLSGGDSQLKAVEKFDQEYLNIASVRQKIADLASGLDEVANELDNFILDTCNTMVNAGAHLIDAKLNLQEKIRWLKDALRASRILQVESTTQAHLGNLGLAYFRVGEIDLAIKHLTEALAIATRIEDDVHQGAWLGNLGMIYTYLAEYDLAIEHYQRHLELAEKADDFRGQCHALENLGVVFARMGDLREARKHYRQSLRLARKIKDYYDECANLINLGHLYHDLGKLRRARRIFNRAKRIASAYQDQRLLDEILVGLADIDIDQGLYALAIQHLRGRMNANDISMSIEMELLQSLGNAYLGSNQFWKAEETYLRLLSIAKTARSKISQCVSACNLACVYRHLGDRERVREYARVGIDLAEALGLEEQRDFVLKQV